MLLMLLAACSGGETLETGSPSPDFTLKDADGVEHSLSDYAGQVVLLDLSAFW